MLEVPYDRHAACPLCGGRPGPAGALEGRAYLVGRTRVGFPRASPKRIPIHRCRSCRLLFKEFVPTPSAVDAVLKAQGDGPWRTGREDLGPVRDLVLAAAPGTSFRLLDVGAGDGGTLRLFADLPVRRSALDVAIDPRCRTWVNGDLVEARLDGQMDLRSSHDVVLALDVLEHLHDPALAWRNLERLAREGGSVVAQTGDADFLDHARDPGSWWYLRMFVHHIAWSADTFRHVAAQGAWRIRSIDRTPHKAQQGQPRTRRAAISALRAAAAVPVLGRALGVALRRDLRLLAQPGVADHLTVVLERAGDRRGGVP